FAGGLPDHHFADVDAFDVALLLAHAAAHVRVERKPEVLHKYFPLPRRRHGGFFEAEILRRDPALGPAREHDALVFHGYPGQRRESRSVAGRSTRSFSGLPSNCASSATSAGFCTCLVYSRPRVSAARVAERFHASPVRHSLKLAPSYIPTMRNGPRSGSTLAARRMPLSG